MFDLMQALGGTMNNNKMHVLHAFMAQATEEMASEYERIYSRAAEDPGTAGDEGEENWAEFLRNWLPSTYHVRTKGRLMGANGETSPQADVVVLKPFYPKKLLEKKVWLASGVAAVFECKTTVTAKHISDAYSKGVEFKKIYEGRSGTPYKELYSPLIYGLLAHSHSWKSRGSRPIENVEKIVSCNCDKVSSPQYLVDVICVADIASWSNIFVTSFDPDCRDKNINFRGGDGPVSAMIRSGVDINGKSSMYTPVGALVGKLTHLLAWEDSSLRCIADYYRRVNIWGVGQGEMKSWPFSVYSKSVQEKILAGSLTCDVLWNEWGISTL